MRPLKSIPTDLDDNNIQIAPLLKLNNDEFITAPHWPSIPYAKSMTNNLTKNQSHFKNKGLFIYNIPNNKWSLFMEYNNMYNPQWHSICIDNKTNKIYSTGNRSSLTIIDLNNKTYSKQENVANIGNGAVVKMINGICHIIGGSKSNKHYIWNKVDCNFEQIYEFKEFGGGFTGFRVIYIKSQNKLLLFGGYMYRLNGNDRSNEIWSHKLGTKEWIKLRQRLPHKMNSFGLSISFNEKSVIIFGGCANIYFHQIYVVNLQTLLCVECKIKVPVRGTYQAINYIKKSDKDELFIYGFVRIIFGNNNKLNVPLEIVNMIISWYSIEFVYLFSTNAKLWKIMVHDIFSQCNDS